MDHPRAFRPEFFDHLGVVARIRHILVLRSEIPQPVAEMVGERRHVDFRVDRKGSLCAATASKGSRRQNAPGPIIDRTPLVSRLTLMEAKYC